MHNHSTAYRLSGNPGEEKASGANVIVCVDDAGSTSKVVSHARAIAGALDAEIMLVHVIEPQDSMSVPLDPVEWDLRRRRAHLVVSRLASEQGKGERSIATRVLEGRFADQICGCVSGRPQDIVALYRKKENDQWRFGGTLHRILESNLGSILLVPEEAAELDAAGFRHIVVPLDGSPRAESVIPVAVKIAQDQGAEMLLVHATPVPVLTTIGAPEPEDAALRDQLQRRNERVAREYLVRIGDRVKAVGLSVRILILKGGDVRRSLTRAIGDVTSALLVMSSHGTSGHGDVSSGDVAGFILTRCSIPMLMIRRPEDYGVSHIHDEAESRGVRHPTGTGG